MGRSREEQETVIRFDATEEQAYVSTFSPDVARRWEKRGIVLTRRGGEWLGRVDKSWVRVSPPPRRILSEEKRDQFVARMARARSEKFDPDSPAGNENSGEE
jgi:hypothetical protein